MMAKYQQKFDETRFLAETHHFNLVLMIFSFCVVPAYPDLIPFDTIGVSATPSPTWLTFGLGGPLRNHIKTRNEVSER